MRFIVFECLKCGHLLYIENIGDMVTKLGVVSNYDCPNCGEEPDRNWRFIGFRSELFEKGGVEE